MAEPTVGNTDIAALSASAVAAAVSVYLTPGPYELISLIVTLTLLIIIVATYWDIPRRASQSLAVAAAVALSSVPGFGFVLECHFPPIVNDSAVPEIVLAGIWAGVFVSYSLIDIWRQNQQRQKSGT